MLPWGLGGLSDSDRGPFSGLRQLAIDYPLTSEAQESR